MPNWTTAAPHDAPLVGFNVAHLQRSPAAELRRSTIGGLAALSIGLAGPALAGASQPWPDTYQSHLEALAVMEQLNGALLASHSATQTLEAWCAAHHMADPARVIAQLVPGPDKPISDEQRARLQISVDEPVRYRHVRLTCGAHVLSDADNWYVPSRLTPEMNKLLETTDIPFGRVVLPLHPQRQTLAAERLWSPLPVGWEMGVVPVVGGDSGGPLIIPTFLFRHRALVLDDQHRPISEVAETYTGETLNFSRPGAP